MNKKVLSKVLLDGHEWFSTSEIDKVPRSEPLVVRLEHPKTVIGEDKDVIMYMEDIKVAMLNKEGEWRILPPHPLYDFSPLSSKDHVYDGVNVSHWRYPINNEVGEWAKRLMPINHYSKLVLEVDKDNERDVYIALIHAANAIVSRVDPEIWNNPDDDRANQEKKDWAILCDLQSAMDYPGINNTASPFDKIDENNRILTQMFLSSKASVCSNGDTYFIHRAIEMLEKQIDNFKTLLAYQNDLSNNKKEENNNAVENQQDGSENI